MDKNTVFVKTKEGEDAVRQRTRLVQRNLRNILIMVDGNATVANLARRFGDETTTQHALAELLAGGFIVESASQLDFTSPLPADAAEGRGEDLPILTTEVEPQAAKDPVPEPPPPPPVIEEISLHAPEYESLPPPLEAASWPKREPLPVAAGPGWAERIKALFAGKTAKPADRTKKSREEEYEEPIGGADPEPVGRGMNLKVGWPVLALIAVVGIAVLPALTLALYPYGRHLPDIERKASAMLQDPVKIGDIGFSFLPRPHIALRNITVGKDAHLSIAAVRAMPDFFSLLGEKAVIHELVLDKVAVKGAGLGRLARAGAGSGGMPMDIRHITLNDLSLRAGDAFLGGIAGEVKMSATGSPENILLRNAEGTLKLEMQPKGEGYRIAASGSGWKTPFKPNLTFQAIDVQGQLQASRLVLDKIDGRVHEGLVEGKASLDWVGSAALTGSLELKRVDATKLLAALGSELSAEGDLSASLKLDAKADSLGKLAEALRVDGSFEMKRGVAKGFDLGEAVRSTGRGATRGGETKFEQLTGRVQYGPQECRLGNLRLASGLLTAGGSLGIASGGKLSGAMNVELKSSATTLRVPLAIGGTTKDPLLTPSRSR